VSQLAIFKHNNEKSTEQTATEAESAEKVYLPYLHDLVTLIAGVILVFSFLFRVVIVSGPSMNSTLIDGDWLLLLGNVLYGEPKKGDIIVASKDSFDNGAPIIKRVIATAGETVDIDFDAGIVYVNGEALDEPYTLTPTNLREGISFPLTVDEGCIFVMGDNRNVSKDSRSTDIGQVDCREVLGKALFLFFPGDPDGARGPDKREMGRIGAVS
jgi:signal peptidase I